MRFKLAVLIITVLLAGGASSAFCWPACAGTWVAVAPEVGSAGGALYTDGHGETWQCQAKPSDPGSTNTNTNSNANSNSNSNKNDQSQNQGQQQGQVAKSSSKATGGNATANGGVSQVKDSGNSASSSSVGPISNTNTASLTNSGNSSNKNNNVAISEGGKGGTSNATATGGNQSQTATAENNSSGNSTSFNSEYKEVRQAPMAWSPEAFSTASCRAAFSGGASSPYGGASLGFSKLDVECSRIQVAGAFAILLHNREAAARILCDSKAAKKSHLTLDQCLAFTAPIVVTPAPLPAPVIAPTLQPIVVNTPAITVLPAPVVVQQPAPAPAIAPVSKPAVKHKVITSIRPCPKPASFSTDDGNCYETN